MWAYVKCTSSFAYPSKWWLLSKHSMISLTLGPPRASCRGWGPPLPLPWRKPRRSIGAEQPLACKILSQSCCGQQGWRRSRGPAKQSTGWAEVGHGLTDAVSFKKDSIWTVPSQVTHTHTDIKKYSSTSFLRIRKVLKWWLCLRYRNNSQKNKAEELKKLTDYFPLLF